jgi:hypothetical protein
MSQGFSQQTTLTHHPAQRISMLQKRLPVSLLQALAPSLVTTAIIAYAVKARLPWHKKSDR